MSVDAPPRPAAQEDPEALIPEARDRQRRRRLIGATVVALAAALGLAVNALVSGGGFLTTIGDSLGLGGGPPACRSTQLKTAHLAPGVPAVFNQVSLLGAGITVVTNASRSACSLPAPEVSIYSHGHKLGVRQVHGLAFRVGPKASAAHVLQPGKSAQIDFTWSNWCGSPTLYGTRELKTVRLRLGDALTVSGKLRKPACVQRGSPSTVKVAELRWVLEKPYAAHHRVRYYDSHSGKVR
jgi:hypothetical protein